jgi:opacity protein-like surface antigen
MFKKFNCLTLAAAVIMLASPAFAADPPTKKGPAAPPPAFTWTGFYIGFNSGYAWAGRELIDVSTVNLFDNSLLGFGPASAAGGNGVVRARLNGFFFGGQAGYNWQFSERLIAGLEADVQGAGVRGGNGQLSVVQAPIGFAATSFKVNRQVEYFGTVRGRLGYAVTPTIMAYVTGGLAYGGVNLAGAMTQRLRPSALEASTTSADRYGNLVGWTVGAGAEMALGRNLSAKLEYLYYDLGALRFGNPSLAFSNALTGAVPIVDATSVGTRYNGHILRAGLNYRFDPTIPETAGSGATPLFASPQFASVERAKYGDWKLLVMPYMWAVNMNGSIILRDETLAADMTLVDAITKSSSFPLSFMGRVEAENGPFWAYGDMVWVRLRFSGSVMELRSPLADLSVAASVNGHVRQTVAIGEAGVGYELARCRLTSAPASFTAIDAYAGMRYANVAVDLTANAVGAANSALLGVQTIGAQSRLKTGNMEWVDPVVGLRMRHGFAPGSNFEMRGDIGGFGAGSKFSWQFFGGYSADFEFNGLKVTSLIGYRALGINYAHYVDGRQDGINAVIHGPVTGFGMRF